ncbi:hypothetical protein BAE44_0010827 [Dichanthelium oligosanthes]|uniref:BPM/SPOP BACK domain-containing protein n=1 Tax=Dichanthelium oligosanthes TaxID=888268 RepID=A0A1E5VSR5_9POAL|nr:hypothetical protein BAE44_0010827 [Dichanthelium oligosanthes]
MATSKTVSTYAAQMERGTHEFRILGCSQLRGRGKVIASDNVFVGGHDWSLVFAPDCRHSKAGIYLLYMSPNTEVLDDLQANDYIEMSHYLLVAADLYDMERLKLMCQSILCKNLSVQAVATTLALSDQHNCDRLKDACIEFITCSNAMDAVAATEGYKNLKRINLPICCD